MLKAIAMLTRTFGFASEQRLAGRRAATARVLTPFDTTAYDFGLGATFSVA
jgi:hypothetical protein